MCKIAFSPTVLLPALEKKTMIPSGSTLLAFEIILRTKQQKQKKCTCIFSRKDDFLELGIMSKRFTECCFCYVAIY